MKTTFLTKRDLSILIGNSLDHFDTALYGFLAPILSQVFFPNGDPIVSLILAYSVFATAIFNRPIGTYLFSIIAKKQGAVLALSYSLIGVAVTTMAIGLIPTYEMIGWISPLLLIIIRMIQGIFAEGESSIASMYILENKVHIVAFKASYLYQASTMVGCITASLVSAILISSNHHEYWRLCFFIGGFSGVVGYFLRRYSLVSDEKIIKVKSETFNLRSFWFHKFTILRVAIITGFSHVTYIIPFIVMNSFVPYITKISLEAMMTFNTILLIADLIMIPLIGRLVERFNPIKIMITALVVIVLTMLPLWWNLNNASLWYVTYVRLWIIIWGVVFLCPLNMWFNSLFSDSDKYMLVGMGKALGSSIFGRLTAPICLLLWHFSNSTLIIGFYILIIAIASIWAIRSSTPFEQST